MSDETEKQDDLEAVEAEEGDVADEPEADSEPDAADAEPEDATASEPAPAPAAEVGVEDQIVAHLNTVQHLLAFSRRRAVEAARHNDGTRTQGRILAFLKFRDGVATKDLSRVLGVDSSSLREVLFRMEAEGLIVRKRSEDDKRATLVFLTDAGREAEQPTASEPEPFAGFEEAELEQLDACLARIVSNLDKDLDEKAREDFRHFCDERNHVLNGIADAPRGPRPDGDRRPPRDDRGPRGDRGGFRGDRRDGDKPRGFGDRDRRDGDRGGYRGDRGGRGFGDRDRDRDRRDSDRGGFRGNGYRGADRGNGGYRGGNDRGGSGYRGGNGGYRGNDRRDSDRGGYRGGRDRD